MPIFYITNKLLYFKIHISKYTVQLVVCDIKKNLYTSIGL